MTFTEKYIISNPINSTRNECEKAIDPLKQIPNCTNIFNAHTVHCTNTSSESTKINVLSLHAEFWFQAVTLHFCLLLWDVCCLGFGLKIAKRAGIYCAALEHCRQNVIINGIVSFSSSWALKSVMQP